MRKCPAPATKPPILKKGQSGETLESPASVAAIGYVADDELEAMALPTGTLDPEVRARFAEDAAYIRERVGGALERILQAGDRLIAVKKKMPHGQWLLWLRDEFRWHERTARNYMNVARAVAKSESLSDLAELSITVEALYILTTRNTPPEALEQAAKEGRAGHVDGKQATAIKRKFKRTESSRPSSANSSSSATAQPQAVPISAWQHRHDTKEGWLARLAPLKSAVKSLLELSSTTNLSAEDRASINSEVNEIIALLEQLKASLQLSDDSQFTKH
jgi:hypothetical protein